MSRKNNKLSWKAHVVLVESPDVQSQASLVLLKQSLFQLDKTYYSPNRMTNLRNRWMKARLGTNEHVICELCGKPCKPFTKLLNTDRKQLKATLDHKQPISKRPEAWNDESNFSILCYWCNHRKGNQSYEQFNAHVAQRQSVTLPK